MTLAFWQFFVISWIPCMILDVGLMHHHSYHRRYKTHPGLFNLKKERRNQFMMSIGGIMSLLATFLFLFQHRKEKIPLGFRWTTKYDYDDVVIAIEKNPLMKLKDLLGRENSYFEEFIERFEREHGQD